MKKIIILAFLIFTLSSCWEENLSNYNSKNTTIVEQNITQEKSNLISVWIDDFKKEIEKQDSVLIDLRTDPEVAEWVIKWWAIKIDYYASDFKDKLNWLDKDKKYLIYCRSWARSWRTLDLMENLWFKNVTNLSGWISNWTRKWWNIVDFEEKTAIPDTQVKTISLDEVKKHNKAGDCYTAIDWKIYNVSSFFWIHPGWDENLLKSCWIDATQLFSWIHWFNAKAQMKKEEFYIWDLK